MKKQSHRLTGTQFRYDGTDKKLDIRQIPTGIDLFYTSEEDHTRQLDELSDRIDQLQNQMHADEHYGILAVFQAMDAGGKDSSIRHVFSGVNPSRFRIGEFKKPSEEDMSHDFLWRFWQDLPQRGYIGVFNRSYYEEVLAVKVHPDRLKESSIPTELIDHPDRLWKERYADIAHFEDYLYRNGFRVVKFYLHVSKEEQGQRLINRLSDSEKQWKLSENDLKEREDWDAYMQAYEDAIKATSTKENPWYIIPSDDRGNQQLIIAQIMVEVLESLKVDFPTRDDKEAKRLIKIIEKQDQ